MILHDQNPPPSEPFLSLADQHRLHCERKARIAKAGIDDVAHELALIVSAPPIVEESVSAAPPECPEISPPLPEDVRKEEIRSRDPEVALIQRVVCDYYFETHAVSCVDIVSNRKEGPVRFVRGVAIYLVRQATDLSLPAIGRQFDGRMRAAVKRTAREIEKRRHLDKPFNDQIEEIKRRIAFARESDEKQDSEPKLFVPTIGEIQRVVGAHYNMTGIMLRSSRRTANVVRPRQVAMYLAKTLTLRSLPEIGRRFGGRDHTTVLHAVRKIEALVGKDAALSDEVELLKRQLREDH